MALAGIGRAQVRVNIVLFPSLASFGRGHPFLLQTRRLCCGWPSWLCYDAIMLNPTPVARAADNDRCGSQTAVDRAIDAQHRMIDANSMLIVVHKELKLRPNDQHLLDQLDEANAQAFACIEQMRSALQELKDSLSFRGQRRSVVGKLIAGGAGRSRISLIQPLNVFVSSRNDRAMSSAELKQVGTTKHVLYDDIHYEIMVYADPDGFHGVRRCQCRMAGRSNGSSPECHEVKP